MCKLIKILNDTVEPPLKTTKIKKKDRNFEEKVRLENTKMIMDFLDKQLDVKKSNKDLSSSLEDDLI